MEENNNENKQENNKEFKTATPLESKQYKVFEQPKKEKNHLLVLVKQWHYLFYVVY